VAHDGYYYWFGESRTGGHSDGISVYRSSDLYNWDHLGYAVVHQGERDDEDLQDISEGRLLERPKVIYNAATQKWVMWAHWENGSDYGQARVAILQADELTGPYTFVKTMRPNGHDSRDQTLFLDTDGNAYHFCSTDMNTNINVVRLSNDFLDCTENEITIMKGRKVEATTVCKVDDTYFATFSECNGWNPAPGHTAMAVGDMLGTWTEGLTFCTDTDASRSYGSQGTYVFSVEGLGYDPKCFIFYGDRWNSSNVGGSTYVWLPLSVRSGIPVVRNLTANGWSLEDEMRDMYRFKRAATIENNGEYTLLDRNSNRMMSRLGQQAGFAINDDDDTQNVVFVFEATDDANVWRLRDKSNNRYLTANRGILREDADGADAKSLWRFYRLANGCYNVVNEDCHRCLTVKGSARTAGTVITLGAVGETSSQAFGVYFDSYTHNYTEAKIFTQAYLDEIAKEVAAQPAIPMGSTGPFVAGKPLAVSHSASGKAMTFGYANDNQRLTVADFTGDNSQKITFTAVPAGAEAEGYNIADANGNYLIKDGNYNTTWSNEADLTSSSTIFDVEAGDGYYLIKNCYNNKYLGTDGTTENAQVYTDKKGEGRSLSYWSFADFDSATNPDPKDLFYEQLDQADITLAELPEEWCGNDAFDYSLDAYTKLKAAFQHGLTVTANYESETATMKAALAEFEANKIVPPVENEAYILRHISGNNFVYVDDDTAPMLGDAADDNTDKFVFEPIDAYYGIKNLRNNRYVSGGTPNLWNMYWAENDSINRSQWTVEISDLGNKVIKSRYTNGYIGCDDTEVGSTLWCNKGSDSENSQWTILLANGAGINNVSLDKANIYIGASQGNIIVNGNKCTTTVYSLSGAMVATAKGNAIRIPATPGIYIVKVSDATSTVVKKLVVR
jgi:hypothetical protein